MNTPRITKISILHLPMITQDTFEILVNRINHDVTRHKVIVQVLQKNYNLERNTIKVKLPTTKPANSNPMQALLKGNDSLRVKAFIYDTVTEKVVEAKLQEFDMPTPKKESTTTPSAAARVTTVQNTLIFLECLPNDYLLPTPQVILGWEKPKKEIEKIILVDVDAADLNGHFYNLDGTFEGKVNVKENKGSVNDVYTCKNKVTVKDSTSKEITTYKGVKLLKENEVNITHSDFCYVAYVVRQESGNNDIEELKCIAYSSFNRSKNAKKTWKNILSTTYSSVENKQELKDSVNNEKTKLTRKSLFYVLNGENDLTNGAEYWDGTDFLAWGNSETNPYNKLGSNKFDEYKFIEIPKDVYDTYLASNGSSTKYLEENAHDKNHQGTHEHITKTVKKKLIDKNSKPVLDDKGKEKFEDVQVPYKIKYSIPASDFKNEDYWKSGSFYYETGNKKPFGISGTINKGKSIFWKLTKTRLTSETPPKK